MNINLAVIPGDGIGPEVTGEALNIIKAVAGRFSHNITFTEVMAGGAAIDLYGEPLPQETLDICKKSDSVVLGAVGGWQWDNLLGDKRPERALLGLRSGLGLYANLRPAVLHPALAAACPLREDIARKGIDIMVVRELTGGMYFGGRGRERIDMVEAAWDTELYSEEEVRRIAIRAFDTAMLRGKRVTNVDKANVLESSRLWREVVLSVAKDYPRVSLNHMYIDNASMQLVRDPSQFDVIVTTNMFGDILSDEASQITGSIGMLPSASLGASGFGMYEPIHGSAPDIAGRDLANPIAAILSAAMMFRYSFGLTEEADAIETAVTKTLEAGYRTADIYSDGMKRVGTKEMGALIQKEAAGVEQ
ncbi:MAG: 3-isopropylmalate dehydrogenase [Clostridiales bacterium]|jgi:3-isopropylmalate dehydrogenase|nr:3-isopropylmalate dehydrogenase [Clostridiales bacterium]